MPPPPAPPPRAPRTPRTPRTPSKSVTFCTRCERKPTPSRPPPDPDVRYYSDPGQPDNPKPKAKKKELALEPIDREQRYYSEPDVKYFEIDYEFLRELRKIARSNCPKCERKSRRTRAREDRVLCGGRYHSSLQHCPRCCRICSRPPPAPAAPAAPDSNDDEYSLASRSYSLPSSRATGSRSRSTPSRRKDSSSNKSVSFLDSSTESMKDEPNYTAKSFTNDLKRFLLKPTAPRLSLRDKFMIGLKQEIEATKRSPKLKAIKGLWKSY